MQKINDMETAVRYFNPALHIPQVELANDQHTSSLDATQSGIQVIRVIPRIEAPILESESNFLGICAGGKGCIARKKARKESRQEKRDTKLEGKKSDVALTNAAIEAMKETQAVDQESLGTGTIIAIAVGGILLLGVIGFVIVRRNKAIAAMAAPAV